MCEEGGALFVVIMLISNIHIALNCINVLKIMPENKQTIFFFQSVPMANTAKHVPLSVETV